MLSDAYIIIILFRLNSGEMSLTVVMELDDMDIVAIFCFICRYRNVLSVFQHRHNSCLIMSRMIVDS